MENLPLIYDFSLPELTNLLTSWGEPSYRAGQVWQGLYQQFWNTADEFSNLPKSLRKRLGLSVRFEALRPVRYLDSSDGRTRKTLFQLCDRYLIEAVLMKYGEPETGPHPGPLPEGGKKKRRTLCISTQAGCAMGCVFCATGQMGFKRHLSSGEIVAQVMYYARMLKERGEQVTNIVFMGMGDPLHNYDNTMAALDRLNDPNGYHFGARRITLSTVGLAPMMRRLADEKRQVNLAVSLHAIQDEVRAGLMPVNKKYNLAEVLEACRYYVEKTGRRITFEWALIQGVNDSPEVARQLAARLKGLLCHVNAIPLNPTAGYKGRATDRRRAEIFKETLEQAGVPCTIRLRRGLDIQAGCGQLAGASGGQPVFIHNLPEQ